MDNMEFTYYFNLTIQWQNIQATCCEQLPSNTINTGNISHTIISSPTQTQAISTSINSSKRSNSVLSRRRISLVNKIKMSSSDSDSDSDTKGPCNWQEIPGLTTQSEVFGPCCWKSAPTDPSQMPHSLIEYELKYYYEPSPLPKDVCYDLDCPETDPHLDRYNSLEYAFNHLCWDLRNKLNNEIYLLKAKHDALNRDYAALLGQVIGSSAVKISSEPWERLHCDADRSFENWEECVCCNCFRKLEHSFWEKIWETRSLMVDLDFLRIEHLELIEKYAWLKYNVALSYNIPESEGWSPHGNLEFPSSVFTDSYE